MSLTLYLIMLKECLIVKDKINVGVKSIDNNILWERKKSMGQEFLKKFSGTQS